MIRFIGFSVQRLPPDVLSDVTAGCDRPATTITAIIAPVDQNQLEDFPLPNINVNITHGYNDACALSRSFELTLCGRLTQSPQCSSIVTKGTRSLDCEMPFSVKRR